MINKRIRHSESLSNTRGFSRTASNRNSAKRTPLSPDERERVLGIERLIRQVERMILESGDPAGFDPVKWVNQWLENPLPALGDRRPASYMNTIDGQTLVSNLLSMTQSGAYA